MTVDAANAASGAYPSSGLSGLFNGIASAIRQAADATGASFEYLLTTAKMESNFNPTASAGTSSAKGLYQFIEQTWLGTVKEAGPALGYSGYADAITKSPSGTYSVADPATRDAILKLRNDPTIASAMAGVLTQSNSFKLTGLIGRRPTDSELYMAHFMGVGGAAKLIANAQDNPQASGARLFPNAAAANRPIFYDRDGRARSVSDVYAELNRRYQVAANSPATRASSSEKTPVAATSAPILPGSAGSAMWRQRRRSGKGSLDQLSDDIGLAQPHPFGRGAETGVAGEAGVGVDVHNKGRAGFVHPEIEPRIAGEPEEAPCRQGQPPELLEQRPVGCAIGKVPGGVGIG